jgi:hypothetical protein
MLKLLEDVLVYECKDCNLCFTHTVYRSHKKKDRCKEDSTNYNNIDMIREKTADDMVAQMNHEDDDDDKTNKDSITLGKEDTIEQGDIKERNAYINHLPFTRVGKQVQTIHLGDLAVIRQKEELAREEFVEMKKQESRFWKKDAKRLVKKHSDYYVGYYLWK